MDSCYFEFTVIEAVAEGNHGWEVYGWGNNYNNSHIPKDFRLYSNVPNPFNATTAISFDMAESGNVKLDIYNLKGQRIATLVDSYLETGHHIVNWNASSYSSGIYFYKLSVGEKVFTKRMTLLK